MFHPRALKGPQEYLKAREQKSLKSGPISHLICEYNLFYAYKLLALGICLSL